MCVFCFASPRTVVLMLFTQRPMSAVKVVGATGPNAPPAIRDAGLPATTLVFDEETARVKAVVNAAQLTAVRSACV